MAEPNGNNPKRLGNPHPRIILYYLNVKIEITID